MPVLLMKSLRCKYFFTEHSCQNSDLCSAISRNIAEINIHSKINYSYCSNFPNKTCIKPILRHFVRRLIELNSQSSNMTQHRKDSLTLLELLHSRHADFEIRDKTNHPSFTTHSDVELEGNVDRNSEMLNLWLILNLLFISFHFSIFLNLKN